MPVKIYEADHEKTPSGEFAGHLMSDYEKEINRVLASNILETWFQNKPIKILDIGAKYPYFAHCFRNMGCEAFAMDNIDIVPEYSKELGVPMLMADFEQISEEQISEWTRTNKFDLITMIHVAEHLYNPLEALRKMRSMVSDTGYVFLRLPDHGVDGFERDLTPGHYTIHPFFHCLDSLLELLVQGQDLFTVEATFPSLGQRDLVLRPLVKKPTMVCGMIVKNEERDLPKCLATLEGVVDSILIVDTGSTDNTVRVALTSIKTPVSVTPYIEASKKDATGDWKLQNFSQARNRFVELIEASGSNYLMWMDADDTLQSPKQVKRAMYLNQYDVFGVSVSSNGIDPWVHHRIWKCGKGIKFEGAIHEYPNFGNLATYEYKSLHVFHDAAATGVGEDSNARNLRILLNELEEKPNDTRTLFYLANTYKDGSKWAEAVDIYTRRINVGVGYRDEWLFAYLYKARCQRANGDLVGCESTLLEGLSKNSNWSEFWMELSYLSYSQSKWEESIGYCLEAQARPMEYTALWRESNKYTDQPWRNMAFCYEHLGDIPNAIKSAERAKIAINCEDESWNQYLQSLQDKLKPKEVIKKIGLCRPGAIGDVIMTLNLVPELRNKYPGYKIEYFTHPTIVQSLADLFQVVGVDEVKDYMTPRNTNDYELFVNFIGYPLHENYPLKPMSRHLIEYFAIEAGLEPDMYKPGNIKAPRIPNTPETYITIHPTAGWSHYKEWDIENWEAVVREFPGYNFIQLGSASDPKITGVDHSFMGNPLIDSIKLISNAKLHLGIDSFSNHTTYMVNTPAVILFGSTQPSASGYPQNKNISLNLPCQPCFKEAPNMTMHDVGPCINPSGQVYADKQHACMKNLPVSEVVRVIKTML